MTNFYRVNVFENGVEVTENGDGEPGAVSLFDSGNVYTVSDDEVEHATKQAIKNLVRRKELQIVANNVLKSS